MQRIRHFKAMTNWAKMRTKSCHCQVTQYRHVVVRFENCEPNAECRTECSVHVQVRLHSKARC